MSQLAGICVTCTNRLLDFETSPRTAPNPAITTSSNPSFNLRIHYVLKSYGGPSWWAVKCVAPIPDYFFCPSCCFLFSVVLVRRGGFQPGVVEQRRTSLKPLLYTGLSRHRVELLEMLLLCLSRDIQKSRVLISRDSIL